MAKPGKFRFRQHDIIGAPDAESDSKYLSKCFVDTGALDIIHSCDDRRGIVLGRTGAGKTALLTTLEEREERVVSLDPHGIALSYLSSSSVLKFLESLGVDLDPFYRFLWRHVITVELLKRHFDLRSEDQKAKLWDELQFTILRKQSHKEAFKYLNTWGTSFVASTEERIKETTKKLESDVRAAVGTSTMDFAKLGAEGGQKLTEEQRSEWKQRGDEVISGIQVNKLTVVFNALDEDILTDHKKRYYIAIDRLDEDWIDDAKRYRLIRALIETMREVNKKIRHAKVVIALRTDLFDRVLRNTTGPGFQDEKYRALCIPVTWTEESLKEVVNTRINELVQSRYTGQPVTHQDLLPDFVRSPDAGPQHKQRSIDYMLDRTMLRPRDIIAYLNLCIKDSEGDATIRPSTVRSAEPEYSQGRLTSLQDEWSTHYPYLIQICNVLKHHPESFRLGDIAPDDLTDICIGILAQAEQPIREPISSEDSRYVAAYYNGEIGCSALRSEIARTLYRVGIVGLKTESYNKAMWSYNGGRSEMPSTEVNDETRIYVHSMVWRALGITSRSAN